MSENLTELISSIYDATLCEQSWPEALQRLSRHVGSLGATLSAIDDVGLPFKIEQSTFPQAGLRYYFDHFSVYDHEAVRATLDTHPVLHLIRDEDFLGDADAYATRADYAWLHDRIGARRRACVRLSQDRGRTDLLMLPFERSWQDLPPVSAWQLDRILPHLAKAVEINRHFSLLRQRYQAVLGALDHVRIGICIIDRRSEVLIANSEAQRILDDGDAVALDMRQRLNLPSETVTAELHDAVQRMTMAAAGQSHLEDLMILAPRRSDGGPIMIELAPLRDVLGEVHSRLEGAIAFIVDTDHTHTISTARMARLFGLTEAEAEICRYMIDGFTAREIADVRNVSAETVKTQVKSIYAKTKTGRRADLIRLAITVDPPIGPVC